MALDEQIAQIVNPQEFTRLCNHVLSALYPGDYQVVDGTRGDAGNDGYIRSEQRILAFHCPIKPEQRTDRDYQNKMVEDLDKACGIRERGDLPVLRWTFVTPRKLSHDVLKFLEAEAKRRGLEASHIESTYLANGLLAHEELIKEFPQLHVSELEELMRRAVAIEEGIEGHVQAAPAPPEGGKVNAKGVQDEENYARVLDIRQHGIAQEGRAELRTILYKSKDALVQLNAVLGVLETFDPMIDKAPDMIGMCDFGIALTKQLKNGPAQAVLLAKKGYFLSFMHSSLDIQEWGQHQADLALGMSFEPERRARNLARLKKLKAEYVEAFNSALELSQTESDAEAFATVLLELGGAAGLRSGYLGQTGLTDASDAEFAICKDALLRAKNVLASIGDERGALRATYALANQLRFGGETDQAKELVEYVIEQAPNHDDRDLLQKALWLKETLDTGRVPDYLAGERRLPTIESNMERKK